MIISCLVKKNSDLNVVSQGQMCHQFFFFFFNPGSRSQGPNLTFKLSVLTVFFCFMLMGRQKHQI